MAIGEHRGDGCGAPDSGIKTSHRDPEMGKGKAVPAAALDALINSQSTLTRGPNDPAGKRNYDENIVKKASVSVSIGRVLVRQSIQASVLAPSTRVQTSGNFRAEKTT